MVGRVAPEAMIVGLDASDTLLDGDVEVHPHQDKFACDVRVCQRALGHPLTLHRR